MPLMKDLLPAEPADQNALSQEQLAAVVLAYLNTGDSWREIQPSNLANDWVRQVGPGAANLLMEGWAWLIREALIAQMAGYVGTIPYQVTRRGRQVKSIVDFEAIQNAGQLPRAILHPRIVSNVAGLFSLGKYDTAVFEAFREVEIAVRDAGEFPPEMYGTDLMRKAFGPNGPLRSADGVVSEEEAIANLFAGAMGFCKNPTSHRKVDVERAASVELICLASHLMRVVDERAKSDG